MVKHIVFLKFDGASDEAKYEIKERLLALKESVPVLKSIEVGINFSTEKRAYDMALLTDFDSRADLQAYAIDPLHVDVIKLIKSHNAITKVVDYEY